MLLGLLTVMVTGTTLAAEENNVRLYGALVAEPCVIPPGEEEVTLDFGTIIDKYLYLNSRTPSQLLSIHLMQCDLNLGKTMKITFIGTENAALPGLLAINGGGSVGGIAIGLETQQGEALLINQFSGKYLLQKGDNRIVLKAYVQGEPKAIRDKAIMRGPFMATATFKMEYE